jgi:predicted HTH transcriptional regulator
MNVDQRRIDELIARPSESLNVEIKAWISPDDPSGVAKIVRAALALRNRNGGYLVVGFNDKTYSRIPGMSRLT